MRVSLHCGVDPRAAGTSIHQPSAPSQMDPDKCEAWAVGTYAGLRHERRNGCTIRYGRRSVACFPRMFRNGRWIQSLAIAPSNTSGDLRRDRRWACLGLEWLGLQRRGPRPMLALRRIGWIGKRYAASSPQTPPRYAVTGGRGNNVWELVSGTWQNRSGNFPTDLEI